MQDSWVEFVLEENKWDSIFFFLKGTSEVRQSLDVYQGVFVSVFFFFFWQNVIFVSFFLWQIVIFFLL